MESLSFPFDGPRAGSWLGSPSPEADVDIVSLTGQLAILLDFALKHHFAS